MGRYTNNHCAVCFHELIRPQNTCGASDCLAEWKTWGAQRRFARKNLAHMPPAERALALAQGPSDEELEAAQAARESLQEQLAAHNTPKPDLTPQFIREALNPNNLKPKGGDLDEANELPASKSSTP